MGLWTDLCCLSHEAGMIAALKLYEIYHRALWEHVDN